MRYSLSSLLTSKTEKCQEKPWEKIESQLGVLLPEDYKRFISQYGAGAINDFLWILSPFCENVHLNLMSQFKIMKEAYETMRAEFPGEFDYEFYHQGKGLFPWGCTANGDELYWDFSKENSCIVVIESGYSDFRSYSMGMEEFIYKILARHISCPIFPDDFVRDENHYTSV